MVDEIFKGTQSTGEVKKKKTLDGIDSHSNHEYELVGIKCREVSFIDNISF